VCGRGIIYPRYMDQKITINEQITNPNTESNFDHKILEMANICSLYIHSIYAPIVFYKNDLKVIPTISKQSLDNTPFIHFQITCNERDDGIIIGRSGATINAIRLLTHAYSKANLQGTPCVIEIKDHRQSKFNPMVGGSLYRRK
jgi:predicted RNA-binding protein YlqC (UPF0109 family)